MKFVKIDKEKFKPTKNSVKELIFLAYLSFILFICTEVMSAMGTTSYGYIEKTVDNSTFAKYGDFYKGGRISKSYYQIYLNNQTRIHYTDANAKKTISSVKARVCGSNYEPSAGTRISIKFSADN